MNDYISLDKCKNRILYRINSRNLSFGVFNIEQSGFVGIREKFGTRYLFTEYHWDTGTPFGTVHPIEELEPLPDDINIKETLDIVDAETGKDVIFREGIGWCFANSQQCCEAIRPQSVENEKLFKWLESKEKQYHE